MVLHFVYFQFTEVYFCVMPQLKAYMVAWMSTAPKQTLLNLMLLLQLLFYQVMSCKKKKKKDAEKKVIKERSKSSPSHMRL